MSINHSKESRHTASIEKQWQVELPKEVNKLLEILHKIKIRIESGLNPKKNNVCVTETPKTFDTKTEDVEQVDTAITITRKIQGRVKDLLTTSLNPLTTDDLQKPWRKLGEGNFGKVYQAWFRGSQVAVKLFKKQAEAQIIESNLLRCISHENIIAFRGFGYIDSASEEDQLILKESSQAMLKQEQHRSTDSGRSSGSERSQDADDDSFYPKMFFVMEFLEKDLLQYVIDMETHERHGLSSTKTWDIGKQLTGALSYLHSLRIAHRDLKPDNILIKASPNQLLVKIADFGLAWEDMKFNINPSKYGSTISSSSRLVNIRWGPPESFQIHTKKPGLEDFQKGDVYCLGLILFFTHSGVKPFVDISSQTLGVLSDNVLIDKALFDKVEHLFDGTLKDAIRNSLSANPEERETVDQLYKYYFSSENPYKETSKEGEMFSCGFMTHTDIFVADSCTAEDASQIGYYTSEIRPTGYNHEDLRCSFMSENAPYNDLPEEWEKEEEYIENYQTFKEQALDRIIDNNPTFALKKLVLSRPGEDEAQRVELYFKQSEYVHHRAMRKIWMSLSNAEKSKEIPNKGEVNSYFSNSFAVHVAVLTNEDPGKPQMFVFPQRAMRAGMPAPGAFTCGAVESASEKDIIEVKIDDILNVNSETDEFMRTKFRVDLIKTAARGLQEELGVDLTDQDLDAICLTTIYLKVDTHEWGLCGYVDLTDDRVKPENQLSAKNISDMFTSGPKDKFEHKCLTFIPFKLEEMVEFVSNNHEKFASSAKLVVVKVLQAFFGWSNVQREFEVNK